MADRNQFVGREAIHKGLGIDTYNLGFVGLEFAPIPVGQILFEVGFTEPDYVYAGPTSKMHWVKGPVGEHPHATVKYGLLTPAHEMKEIVDELLGDVAGIEVEIAHIVDFGSQNPELPYSCIVAELGSEMHDLNAALGVLPHIDSFANYRSHITLAYVQPRVREVAIDALSAALQFTKLKVTGVDYGRTVD
jgi:hypothetical protein